MTRNQFTDIDNYITNCNMELSITNYLKTGKLDNLYFKKKYQTPLKYSTTMDNKYIKSIDINKDDIDATNNDDIDDPIIEPNYIDVDNTIQLLKESINNCNNLYSLIENEYCNNIIENTEIIAEPENECPICLCKLEKTNVVIPNCNHILCINCFIQNLCSNSFSGHKCSLCRENIIS